MCDDRLHGLLSNMDIFYKTLYHSDDHPIVDDRIPLINFPHLLGTTLENVPFTEGYLKPHSSSLKTKSEYHLLESFF